MLNMGKMLEYKGHMDMGETFWVGMEEGVDIEVEPWERQGA